MKALRLTGGAIAMAAASPAIAACPMPLAIYSEPDSGASVEFQSTTSMMATNAFRMLLRGDTVLDGFVMWTDDPGRPYGTLMHNCPEGDVTGDEIAACTAWEGVIYAVHTDGGVGPLPTSSEMAPPTLIFADLGSGLRLSPAYEVFGRDGLPWDAFMLSGCQE